MVMGMMIACGIPVLFLYTPSTIIPVVTDSQAPFCGPLRRKRKMVLKRSRRAAEHASKNEGDGGTSGRTSGHLWFAVKNCHRCWPFLVVLNLLQEI